MLKLRPRNKQNDNQGYKQESYEMDYNDYASKYELESSVMEDLDYLDSLIKRKKAIKHNSKLNTLTSKPAMPEEDNTEEFLDEVEDLYEDYEVEEPKAKVSFSHISAPTKPVIPVEETEDDKDSKDSFELLMRKPSHKGFKKDRFKGKINSKTNLGVQMDNHRVKANRVENDNSKAFNAFLSSLKK